MAATAWCSKVLGATCLDAAVGCSLVLETAVSSAAYYTMMGTIV